VPMQLYRLAGLSTVRYQRNLFIRSTNNLVFVFPGKKGPIFTTPDGQWHFVAGVREVSSTSSSTLRIFTSITNATVATVNTAQK
jgi:hypothetical protein